MLVAHISDLHLGKKSPGDPHGAGRLTSFRNAVAALAEFHPETFVIAGDAFDSRDTEAAIIEEAASILAGARHKDGTPIPTVIIPGNHDPADADNLWTCFAKAAEGYGHVSVARESALFPLADGRLLIEAYPCPTRYSAEPPWEKRLPVSKTAPDTIRVVVAHGTLQGGPVPEGETDAYPFTQADLEQLTADYVALGHFHGVYPAWGDAGECTRAFSYCGTHEPDQYGGDSGYAILIELTARQPARLRRIKTGRRTWRQLAVATPADLAEVEKLLEETKACGDPSRYVIRLKVQGNSGWSTVEVGRLQELTEKLQAVGTQAEQRGTPRTRVDVSALDLDALPSGAVKEALVSLKADVAQTQDERRREILTEALLLGWEKFLER